MNSVAQEEIEFDSNYEAIEASIGGRNLGILLIDGNEHFLAPFVRIWSVSFKKGQKAGEDKLLINLDKGTITITGYNFDEFSRRINRDDVAVIVKYPSSKELEFIEAHKFAGKIVVSDIDIGADLELSIKDSD